MEHHLTAVEQPRTGHNGCTCQSSSTTFYTISNMYSVTSVVSKSFLKGTEPFLRPKVRFIMTQNTPCTPLQMINVHQRGFTVE